MLRFGQRPESGRVRGGGARPLTRIVSLAGVAWVLAVACARDPVHPPTLSAGSLPEPPASSASASPASAGAAAAPSSSARSNEPPPWATPNPNGRGETACDGADDDGDGVVDVLLPTTANACHAALPGACSQGYAACEDGRRVCLAPAPTPEVFDGVDDDCNGVVDDVPAVSIHPRALVLAPRYAWSDAGPDLATVTAILEQAGIPFDRQPPSTDWDTQLPRLASYALAVVPGYLIGSAVNASMRHALEEFAGRGGVVVVFKPVGASDQRQAWELTGLLGSTRRRDVLDLRFDGARTAAVSEIDTPEERTLRINGHAGPDAVEAYLLDPDPAAGTQVIAHAYGGASAGAVITRRPVGKGAIYAFGHDLTTFGASRCYVNCFDPSGDVLRLFFDGALREGSSGHVVLKHTMPGEMSSILLVTHDVDAPDAFNEGTWGPPGAIQMARMEQARSVRATYNITTDFVAGYFNEHTVHDLCDLGNCPLGAHSVTHPEDFARLPDGTCTETRATYGTPRTLCGELRVSRDIVAGLVGRAPRVWRSPYLTLPPSLFELLAKLGFEFDSGFGVGDLPYNLPVDLKAVGFHQNRFRRSPLLEFPISCEDGRDEVRDGAHHRVELDAENERWFVSTWQYVLIENARNRSMTVLLVHPSRGRDEPLSNVRTKVEAVADFLDRAATAGVPTRPMEVVGDFWRARLDATLDATYDDASGYAGTWTVGRTTAPGLTLEFGDELRTFSCSACGPVRVVGRRVVIEGALPAGTRATFTARVK